ncbi:serine/threonine-protein kinase [Streptomyces endophytica]|uniref:non-specific serine/threonine protein kinase n=1 Tax=Streptomyces endophytica TaxID=2991496 RepID=A0ABY6PA34_9ACTN|nr:serine/threonine-protein kinase [Streptomyces endophytica]UZJ30468.1 serine/threonine protein kinase [Streptomyces endophytica]
MGEIFAGRYELIDPIGRGGVGAVWRAWDHRRRRYVAAKVLQQSDAHTLLRFVREQALRIDHPHVLAPASWAADDDKVLFTMDLVSGGSLAHLTGDYGPLPARFVCTLLDQLLAGLTAVHAEGVVHRDIKPANILLEATGTGRPHLRLSDFGIAMRKGEPRLTEANYVVGTPGYFAPEQLLGAEPDFPGDLFAVGLVAIYLLTGVKPDPEALIGHFADGIPNAPEGVPEPLWQVLASLVHPNPDARFKTATGARKAILSVVELLPEATVEDEVVEVFDHIGPLPAGFGPEGPLATDGPDEPTQDDGPAAAGAGTTGPGTAGRSTLTGTGTSGRGSFAGTDSFPLAPPEPRTPPEPTTPPTPAPLPQPVPATPPPPPVPAYEPTAAVRPEAAATRPYTAGPHLVPGQPPAGMPAAAPTVAPPAPYRKPGPPPKVAVPVLIVALLCIAVGVWALLSA